MSHLRKQIRDRLETNLTGLTTTGSNIFTSRVYMINPSQLPSLSLFTNEEAINIGDSTPGSAVTYDRALTASITAHVKANDTADDTLDTIIKEVEHALAADPTLNALCLDLLLLGIDIELDNGDQPILSANIEYIIRYRTLETDVENAV